MGDRIHMQTFFASTRRVSSRRAPLTIATFATGLADEEQYYHGSGDEDRLGHEPAVILRGERRLADLCFVNSAIDATRRRGQGARSRSGGNHKATSGAHFGAIARIT
jgi:hypothetical protein